MSIVEGDIVGCGGLIVCDNHTHLLKFSTVLFDLMILLSCFLFNHREGS